MIDIKSYGIIPENVPCGESGTAARVTAVHKERYGIVCQQGECFARLKSSVYFAGKGEPFPTVGDFVTIAYNPAGDSVITHTFPRKTFFARRDPTPGRGEQAVAANFDYVFIMQSLNHNFNIRRLERYLALAWQSGASPVVILTKADLKEEIGEELAAAESAAIGAPAIAVSALEGTGLDALSEYLAPGKTIVFLGSSGVGKSSLLNALAGEALMQVGAAREEDSRGRHTTTHRELILLSCGAMVIDTPGMRELGMWEADAGIEDAFSDIEQYVSACRFSDCSHTTEPGCAVRAALAAGALSNERWQSYLKLRQESHFSDDKAEYLRKKQAWHKGIAKQIRQQQKFGKH